MGRPGRRVRGVVVVALAAACSGSGTSSGCGATVTERLDPQSLIHVIDGDDVTYLSDPPTSGPHAPAPVAGGTVDVPLGLPAQVNVLEQGKVLLQHRDLSEVELARLEALGSADVVIAPNPDLGDRIVATAWLTKLRCDRVDADALARFVADAVGRAPSHS